ncbi:hypothetical protein GRF29_161g531829 [Pseudopithomyces chartarum]|uniref:Uncharacterized protein n=1 Tax=Pseudopithomyces chartarum TaxID=1892770 RepID=A0AAN6LQK0_9PLEO|nr:hypothetical protein GRF29_161g531829 [Pseudopithomyces chartarum]
MSDHPNNLPPFEDWHRMLKATEASEPSKKRARSPDAGSDVATPEPATSKRARTDEVTSGPPVVGEISPRRPIAVLMQTRWADMTDAEKARILLPMMQGQHPIDLEADEHKYGASYGAIRQREALQKAQGLTNLAAAEITPPSQASSPEVFDQDLAAKKAEEKREKDDKRAAYMRKRRADLKRHKKEMMVNGMAVQQTSAAQQEQKQHQQHQQHQQQALLAQQKQYQQQQALLAQQKQHQKQQALVAQQREQVLRAEKQQEEENESTLFCPGVLSFLGHNV